MSLVYLCEKQIVLAYLCRAIIEIVDEGIGENENIYFTKSASF